MPDFQYDITYRTKVDQAVGDIGRLQAAAKSCDAQLEQLERRLRGIGTSLPGLAKAIKEFEALTKEVKTADAAADKCERSVRDVGRNTGNMSRATSVAGRLKDQLDQLANAATNATVASSQVGAGVGGGAGGGGGSGAGGGGGGSGGMFSGYKGVARRVVAGIAIHQAFKAARQYTRTTAEGMESAREYNERVNTATAEFRRSLGEAAILEGKNTVDDEMVRDQLKLIRETGTTPDDALEARKQFKGAIGAGLSRGNITQATADKLMPEAIRFGTRNEMDPTTTGKMFGLISEYMKVPDVETAMKKVGAMQGHLNLLGVGSMRKLAPSLQGLMGEMAGDGGRIGDPELLAATFAASTVKAKTADAGATNIRQANTGLLKLIGQMGITDQDDFTSSIRKVAPKLKGMNTGQQRTFLKASGIGNSEEQEAIIGQAELIPVIDKQMQDPRVKEMSENAMKNNQVYMNSEVGRTYQSEAKLLSAEIERGLIGETTSRVMREAKARLSDSPDSWTKAGTWQRNWNESFREWSHLGAVSGEEDVTAENAIANLQERGKKVGYDLGSKYPGLVRQQGRPWWMGGGRTLETDEIRNKELGAAAREIESLETAKLQREAAQMQKDAAQMNRDAAARQGGGIPAVAPVVP